MNYSNFFARNEGELIGTLGGVFIALLASFLTYFLARNQTNKREKKNYQGILYVLHVELFWHNNQIQLLKQTLNHLKSPSLKNKSFILSERHTELDGTMISAGLLKLIEYKRFHNELLALLTSYLNKVKDINRSLDFKIVNDILKYETDDKKVEQRIADYLNVLNNEYIDKSVGLINDIQEIISSELKHYPSERMIDSKIISAHNN